MSVTYAQIPKPWRVYTGCFDKPRYRVKAWRVPNEDRPGWRTIVARHSKAGNLPLSELLILAQGYRMTDQEIEAQRQSWARQMMD